MVILALGFLIAGLRNLLQNQNSNLKKLPFVCKVNIAKYLNKIEKGEKERKKKARKKDRRKKQVNIPFLKKLFLPTKTKIKVSMWS